MSELALCRAIWRAAASTTTTTSTASAEIFVYREKFQELPGEKPFHRTISIATRCGIFLEFLLLLFPLSRRHVGGGNSSSGIIQELYGWKFKFHGSLIIHLSFSYLITFIQKFNSPCWWSALGVGNWTRPRWRGLIMSETKPIFGSWEVFG